MGEDVWKRPIRLIAPLKSELRQRSFEIFHEEPLPFVDDNVPSRKTASTLPGNVIPSNGDQPHFVLRSSRRIVVGLLKFSTVSEAANPGSMRPNFLGAVYGLTNSPGFAAQTSAIRSGEKFCSISSQVTNTP